MPHPPAPKKNWLARYGELIGTWARKAGNPQDAEDAVQDAALNMLERDVAVLRDQEHYFQRAVANRAISLYRAGRVRQTQPLDAQPEETQALAPSAHDLYEADEMMRVMLAALRDLPQPCQQAFRLRQDEGLTNGEIATKMGVSRNMVERYMMRTLRHLQDQLQNNVR